MVQGCLVVTNLVEAAKDERDEQMSDLIEARGSRIEAVEAASSEIGLRARAKVETRPSIVYEILTDPNSIKIFRNMKVRIAKAAVAWLDSDDCLQACTFRKILEEDKRKGTRKLEVGHQAVARFLWISVTFETRLLVQEDDKLRRIRFQNADDKGIMKRFEGLWDIRDWNEAAFRSSTLPVASIPSTSLLSLKDSLADALRGSGLLKAESALKNLSTQWTGHGSATLAILEQTVQPRSCPPGMKGLIRRLCAAQVGCMLEDLNAEVDRREGRVQKGQGKGRAAGAPAASLTVNCDPPPFDSNRFEAFLKPLQLQMDEPMLSIKIRL